MTWRRRFIWATASSACCRILAARHRLRIDLPRRRDQLTTRELPEFLQLRRELFDFIKEAEA